MKRRTAEGMGKEVLFWVGNEARLQQAFLSNWRKVIIMSTER